MRRYCSSHVASFFTFLASGILHEYTLFLAAVGTKVDNYSYTPKYGWQLLFFLWNFSVMGIEFLLRGNKTIQYWSAKLPKPVITALVLLTVLPISHWFTDEWILAGFITGVSRAFPRIVWER